MKSPFNLYMGIMDALRAIKSGEISKEDRAAILKRIQKHDSRADESDVDDVLKRL